ncbi:MAG: sodium-dependent bicarbonate transport family permease [Phycisphaeraceae bacterium]|nr:MAG: sodium-dependent bicarbonate transport family permease [Phycisphaeraceae bacterium]
MDLGLLLDNLLSPPIMFFALGVAAGLVKSDLAIPEAVTKLLSLYLLWSIGLKGGVQLRSGEWSGEVVTSLLAALSLATVIPLLVFAFLRPRLGADNAGALAAVYGSVSAVTFLTACAYLNRDGIPFGGHMVAALAVMESPAIIIAVLLVRRSHARARDDIGPRAPSLAESLREAALNGPVVLLTGSMAIGAAIGEEGFKPLAPLAASLFPGVLAFFLLELGLLAAKKSRALRVVGPSLIAFGLVVPLLGAAAAAGLARALSLAPGNAFLLIVLASSASYIAAPAAARTAIPRASPGLYVPLALAVTFPFNIALGIPLYWQVVRLLWKDVN